MQFDAPARYFPITRGLYEVTPGLKPLGTDFGNGVMDSRVFQIDTDFPRFRANKLACRKDRLEKYFQQSDLSADTERALVEWLIDRFTTEYPNLFSIEANRLICRHTGASIDLSGGGLLDALANQVAEDICLVCRDDSHDWLAAAHVCSPGHWSAQDKIGKPFTAIHQPVPGIESINRRADQFVDMMIHRGPFVRFAWGFGTDDRLNHHPQPPNGVDPDEWQGRIFDPQNPKFFLRVERQVMWGLPNANAAVFVIRVSHLSGDQIRSNPTESEQLISALKSMTAESRRYKGLEGSLDAVLAWLITGDVR